MARKAVDSTGKLMIAVGVFFAVVGLHIHPVLMVLAGCLLGVVLFRKESVKG